MISEASYFLDDQWMLQMDEYYFRILIEDRIIIRKDPIEVK